MRITYLTRSLEVGGAEVQLVQTAIAMRARQHDVSVMSFYDRGPLGQQLDAGGVPVSLLRKKSRWDLVQPILRARRNLRANRTQIIHSFLTPANLLAVGLLPLLPNTKVIWGIRASHMDWSAFDATWRLSYGLERRLSRFPHAIVTNSNAGLDQITKDGFDIGRATVVENGIDTARFLPSGRRDSTRTSLGIDPSQIAIGIVARLDPMKGHGIFLRAASLLANVDGLRFVIVGGDGLESKAKLEEEHKELFKRDRVIWAGHRADTPDIYSALDIHVSASRGEGFPNAVAEGMACETATVATDVGDSRRIVGKAGRVVPPEDPVALAKGIGELIRMDRDSRRALGREARQRIVQNYSVETMASRLANVYETVASKGARR